MALGALLSALPEFLTHQYEYESGEIRWGAEGRDVCAANGSTSDEGPDPDLICRNRTATNMMYLLLIGAQVLLGIGATPVQPLGVSYIDDHVRRKDSSLYIGKALWTSYWRLSLWAGILLLFSVWYQCKGCLEASSPCSKFVKVTWHESLHEAVVSSRETVILACIVAMVKIDSRGDYYWIIRKMLTAIVFAQIALNSVIGGLWSSFSWRISKWHMWGWFFPPKVT